MRPEMRSENRLVYTAFRGKTAVIRPESGPRFGAETLAVVPETPPALTPPPVKKPALKLPAFEPWKRIKQAWYSRELRLEFFSYRPSLERANQLLDQGAQLPGKRNYLLVFLNSGLRDHKLLLRFLAKKPSASHLEEAIADEIKSGSKGPRMITSLLEAYKQTGKADPVFMNRMLQTTSQRYLDDTAMVLLNMGVPMTGEAIAVPLRQQMRQNDLGEKWLEGLKSISDTSVAFNKKMLDSLAEVAIRLNNAEALRQLLDVGADATGAPNDIPSPQILSLLVEKNDNPRRLWYNGRTSLMAAAKNGQLQEMKTLLERAPDLLIQPDHSRNSVLEYAIIGKDARQTVSFLLTYPAEKSFSSKEKLRLLSGLCQKKEPDLALIKEMVTILESQGVLTRHQNDELIKNWRACKNNDVCELLLVSLGRLNGLNAEDDLGHVRIQLADPQLRISAW